MPSERDYQKRLISEAGTLDGEVRAALSSVIGASPFFQKVKVKTTYWEARKTGHEEDAYEWRIERDRNFVVRRIRIMLRASRMKYLLQGEWDSQLIAAAEVQKKPNLADFSEYTSTYPTLVDRDSPTGLIDALVEVMQEAF
jgi:hypothetical protein